jgi:hypothetical protein
MSVLCFSGRDAMRQSVAAASMALVPAVQAYLRELMSVAGA